MAQKKNSPSKRQRVAARASGRRVAADRDAAIKSSVGRNANFNVPPAPAGDGTVDPPIIVQGGGSVDMDLPPKFKEKSTGPNGKKFKNDLGTLTTLVIDDPPTTVTLKPTSKITINYS